MDQYNSIPWGSLSNILRVKIRDTSDNNGAGKTGLLFSATGLILSSICDNEATPVTYTAAGSTTETITTLGTFAAPTATKARFKLVDDTNNPGLVEIQLADARYAVAGARRMTLTIVGVSDMEQTDVQIDLTGPNNLVNGNAGGVLVNTTVATYASQTSFTLAAGSTTDDAYNGAIAVIRDSTTPALVAVGVVLDYTGASKTVTLVGNPGFTFGTTDNVTLLTPNATTAEIEAALNGATVTLSGSTFIGTMTISIP